VPFELVPPGTKIDFIGKRHIAVSISILMLLASLAAIPVRGIRLGIDFAGGTEFQVAFAPDAGADEGVIRSIVTNCGVGDPSVIRYGETDESEFLIRFRQDEGAEVPPAGPDCSLSDEQRAKLAATTEAVEGEPGAAEGGGVAAGELIDRLTLALGNELGSVEVQRIEFVGPRVGAELRRDGLSALGIACLLILAYIAFRFSTRFAPGAIVALVHDVGITAGLFVIMGLEFDLRVLAALLAILGYSLNDTIIIYDRIRENMEIRTKHDLVDVLNRSVNQTLARTVLTSGTTLAAVLSLLFLGGEVIRPFAIAMTIGIFVGTYSSVFIAAPTLLWLETRFGDTSGAGAGGEVSRPIPAAVVTRTAVPAPRPQRTSRKKRKKKRK
jgi:preprotein translocase subunit SecF